MRMVLLLLLLLLLEWWRSWLPCLCLASHHHLISYIPSPATVAIIKASFDLWLIGLRRTGKSCRLRWVNYLHPGLKRGRMSPQEERLVLELHARWGNRWSRIARRLPGRTDNEIKNYWRTHMRKEAQERKRRIAASSSPPSSSTSSKREHEDADGEGSFTLEPPIAPKSEEANGYPMDQIWADIASSWGEECMSSIPMASPPLWEHCGFATDPFRDTEDMKAFGAIEDCIWNSQVGL